MNLKSLRLELSREDISNKTIVQFYETVGRLFGVEGPEARYDCTRILIAKNIQDELYKSYELLHPDAFATNPDEFNTQVTIALAKSGPKVEKSFPDNTIEVQDGFFVGKPLSELIKTGLRKIAVITDGYVRDTQVYLGDAASREADPEWELGDSFGDMKYPCHYIGVFEGKSDEEIISNVAAREGIAPDIISLIEIGGC